MRVELHPVFNVHIILEELRNIDLATRGYYQVRLIPKPSQLFSSVDIQQVDAAAGNASISGVLAPSIVDGAAVSRSVELTYIDETLTLGDSFVISLHLDAHADLSSTYHVTIDVELWSMDRHRPPNISLFELDSKRSVEISLCPTRLIAASRHIFFDHSAFAALTMSVYASLVSVLPRRKKQPPDPVVDTKSKQLCLSTGQILLQALVSIERFVVKHRSRLAAAVQVDLCNMSLEMESLKCCLDSTNPWSKFENMVVDLSARLSVLYSQVVRLCIGCTEISTELFKDYKKFREKMLCELFFFVERAPSDLNKCKAFERMFSVVSKSRYLEKLPRFPVFCHELDSSAHNWCLVVEERFLLISSDRSDTSRNSSEDIKAASTNIEAAGDGPLLAHHGSLRLKSSRFSWLRRKSSNGGCSERSKVQMLAYRRPHSHSEDNTEASCLSLENFPSMVDFIMERERLKVSLQEQGIFDGFLYSEQASPWQCDVLKTITKQSSHLVVFVHGLEGSCDDLSSYRNIFRLLSENIPGFYYLLSTSNHAKTWSAIEEMAENLLTEVRSYVTRYCELPTRVSFVAHSLGGVIVRAAISREDALDWLVPRLHCLLTINSPHLGLAYVGKGVHLGIQFMQWWKQSRSMEQLSLKDEILFYESFLYRLSKKRTFGHFRYVLLIGTPTDVFVPSHSALVASNKLASKDPSALGTAYREMLHNIHDDMVSSDRTKVTIRYSTWHSVSSPKASRFTGKAAHIAAVEDDVFIEKFFATSALRYFIE